MVITGATSGIGFAAAEQFAQQGAFVIGIGRSESKNQNALEKILQTNPKGKAVFLLADLASQKQVRRLGDIITSVLHQHGYDYLDTLINNAGVYLDTKQMTQDQVEKTFAVNHLAAFLLTYKLLSWLEGSKNGQVLTMSSYSHRTTPLNLNKIANPRPYIGLLAYKRSKLSNVLFTYELNRRCKGLLALAIDPGLVNTEIGAKGGPGISAWVWRRRRKKGASADTPVRTLLFLAEQGHIDISHSYYFRDCAAIMPSRNAIRQDLAKDLWTLSCRLTGVQWS